VGRCRNSSRLLHSTLCGTWLLTCYDIMLRYGIGLTGHIPGVQACRSLRTLLIGLQEGLRRKSNDNEARCDCGCFDVMMTRKVVFTYDRPTKTLA